MKFLDWTLTNLVMLDPQQLFRLNKWFTNFKLLNDDTSGYRSYNPPYLWTRQCYSLGILLPKGPKWISDLFVTCCFHFPCFTVPIFASIHFLLSAFQLRNMCKWPQQPISTKTLQFLKIQGFVRRKACLLYM